MKGEDNSGKEWIRVNPYYQIVYTSLHHLFVIPNISSIILIAISSIGRYLHRTAFSISPTNACTSGISVTASHISLIHTCITARLRLVLVCVDGYGYGYDYGLYSMYSPFRMPSAMVYNKISRLLNY